jgi:DNA-directed RNA polymerase specialized sigma24 family protein
LRLDHDKVSGALYIKLRDGEYDHTEDFSEDADVYLAVDRDGNVLGLKALSFEDLAQAIGERGGKLEVPEWIAPDISEDELSNLTPEQQDAVRLRVQGFSYDEIASQLSMSVATAYARVQRALQILQEAQSEAERGAPPDEVRTKR